MAGTVTVTGTIGPGNTLTASAFTNVREVDIDMEKNLISIFRNDNIVVPIISIASATTVTSTKSGTTWTLTIS